MAQFENLQSTRLAHGRAWRVTLISGIITIALAAVAFMLPEITLLPRGGLVGWLLLLAGFWEAAFGLKHGLNTLGKSALGSGLITGAAGLLFVLNPSAGYFPVANIVTAWLFLRGVWMLVNALRLERKAHVKWTALTGVIDVLLGLALLNQLPLTALVYSLFGPTDAIVARFSLLLAVSFAVTGLAQLSIAMNERRHNFSSASDRSRPG